MQILLAGLVMGLFSLSSAIIGTQTDNERGGFFGLVTQQTAVRHPQMISQLKRPDEEAPALVMPEQLAHRLTEVVQKFAEAIRKIEEHSLFLERQQRCKEGLVSRYLFQFSLSPEQQQFIEGLARDLVYLASIDIFKTLQQLSEIMRQAARAPEAWRVYLEQTQTPGQMRILSEPASFVPQATALEDRLLKHDRTRPAWQQLNAQEQQWLKTLQSELSLLADFMARQQKRD